jgi:hypothetical protein
MPGVEVSLAKPQEDDSGCRHLSCVGTALATSGLLVEDVLAMHSLLAFKGSLFVKKALSGTSSLLVGGLLAFVGSPLIKKVLAGCHLEAVVLVLPQFLDRPLPILVGAFRVGTSPKKNGPPRQFLEAAGQRPVGLHEVLNGAIPRHKRYGQHWPGDRIFENCRTPRRGRMGEAATTCIAATRTDQRGRMWTNEPAVVHRSSFVEEDEGRSLNSFAPVPTYEGTVELKINEEGVPIKPMEGISEFLEMEGRGGMEINSLSLPRQWRLMLCCRAESEAVKGLVTCQSPHVPESLTTQ